MSFLKRIIFSDKDQYEKDKAELLAILDTITIPPITKNRVDKETGKILIHERENVIGAIGRTCNFGIIKTRSSVGYRNSKHSLKWPRVWDALIKFGKHVCPSGMVVSTITLNYGVKAKKHVDSYNVGDSVIVGIGNYQEGHLRVYDGGKASTLYTAFDIKDKPLMFNGAMSAHETEDFTGERYTIIYYNQSTAKVPYVIDKPINGTGIMEMITTHHTQESL